MFVVRKDGKYFKANGYVESSGRCDTATWANLSDDGWGTSSKAMADIVAAKHGGVAIPYGERDGF